MRWRSARWCAPTATGSARGSACGRRRRPESIRFIATPQVRLGSTDEAPMAEGARRQPGRPARRFLNRRVSGADGFPMLGTLAALPALLLALAYMAVPWFGDQGGVVLHFYNASGALSAATVFAAVLWK